MCMSAGKSVGPRRVLGAPSVSCDHQTSLSALLMQPLPQTFPEGILGSQRSFPSNYRDAYNTCLELSRSPTPGVALAERILGWTLIQAAPGGRSRTVNNLARSRSTTEAGEPTPLEMAASMKDSP
jgi:hypothetical protein